MKSTYRKPHTVNIIVGIVFLILFILTCKLYMDKWEDNRKYVIQFITIAELFIALINFLPRKIKTGEIKQTKKKYSKAGIISILFVVIAVPLTVLAGHYVFNDQRFNLICILIVLELLIPFFLSFESKKPSVRELVIISVICALAIAGRIVFSAVPQFKPIVSIIVIAGIVLGAEKGFLIGAVSALVSNMYFSQGSWTPWQMLALGAMGLLAGIIFNKSQLKKDKLSICIFGGIATIVVYGGIVNFQSLLFYPVITWGTVISTYTMGLPFDLIHAASTVFFLWFIAEPMIEKLERIKTKYNILN